MKIAVSHYKKSDKELFVNGGNLYINGEKLVLKYFFKKIATFNIDKINFKKLPDEFLFKVVEIYDYDKSYVLLLTKANYFKLTKTLNR